MLFPLFKFIQPRRMTCKSGTSKILKIECQSIIRASMWHLCIPIDTIRWYTPRFLICVEFLSLLKTRSVACLRVKIMKHLQFAKLCFKTFLRCFVYNVMCCQTSRKNVGAFRTCKKITLMCDVIAFKRCLCVLHVDLA